MCWGPYNSRRDSTDRASQGLDAGPLGLNAGPVAEAIDPTDARASECEQTFGMDFANYTVGGLFENRHNYDMSHEDFAKALSEIRGRVWSLGWRTAEFGEIDRSIAERSWRRHDRGDKTERYGKKYGWIGYYEVAGALWDRGLLPDRHIARGRLADVDIDPSFPEVPPSVRQPKGPEWIKSIPADEEAWVRGGIVEVDEALVHPETVDGIAGPWVLVEGVPPDAGRRPRPICAGFLRGMLITRRDTVSLVRLLTSRPYLGNHLIPTCPEDYYLFAGEIPWSDKFASDASGDGALDPYQARIESARKRRGLVIELLAHTYAYESYHNTVNRAGGHLVPSKLFAQHTRFARTATDTRPCRTSRARGLLEPHNAFWIQRGPPALPT